MQRPGIGIIGGGQLALMIFEASLRLDLDVRVLGSNRQDPALRVVPNSAVGDATDTEVLLAFASTVDVITFDHELVDPASVVELERRGHIVRPGSLAISTAVDKRAQYEIFTAIGIPTPTTRISEDPASLRAAVDEIGLPVVVKHASGGYDGRGVVIIERIGELDKLLDKIGATFIVQPRVEFEAEIAVQVVRSATGEILAYPVVGTFQEDGICHMVQIPAGVEDHLCREATEATTLLAEHLEVVGILAAEFFVVDGRLLINEIAARPHNSGHITIETSITSQFENHLRAVAGLALGSTDLVVDAASMVNILGSSATPPMAPKGLPADVAVHLYGKTHRPGRKLGHVTAVGGSLDEVVIRARRAAAELAHQGARA
jgi:5-(carboxyamino)imidazole ribonucleotide synthase